jgi:predicted sugar kinase
VIPHIDIVHSLEEQLGLGKLTNATGSAARSVRRNLSVSATVAPPRSFRE